MKDAIVLFTRDLRVHDNPALAAAHRAADRVTPLFVLDDAIIGRYGAPNRVEFLLESLADLRGSLRARGGDLVVRRGETVAEVVKLARRIRAGKVFAAADVSAFARTRQARLAEKVDLELVEGVTMLAPDAVAPTGGDHFKVFGAYQRAWMSAPKRSMAATPRSLTMPDGIRSGAIPRRSTLVDGAVSPHVVPGGETQGRRRLNSWIRRQSSRYADDHDDMAGDATSRLSPYLHFGCLSATEVADRADKAGGAGPDAFKRQLVWRDFHHQVTHAFPAMPSREYRGHGDRWRHGEKAAEAWRKGCTGIPIVDAGMRQLLDEGWMHNRARLIVGSFLTKDLYLDWRIGAEHFFRWLVDGDIANNAGNWQWVAGTGNDSRPNRVFNPARQARRYDPAGEYVRRWVPELSTIAGPAIHEPWNLPESQRHKLDYPAPIVDHARAAEEFKQRRA